MLKLTIGRELLLKPLQMVSVVADRKQTQPILAHVLFDLHNNVLTLTASDLEVELVGTITLEDTYPDAQFTLPAKKLLDICKTLPENISIELQIDQEKALLRAAKTKFTLSTLPAESFPRVEAQPGDTEFVVTSLQLKQLIAAAQFAMAQQDVRFYLNGLFIQLGTQRLIAVATDGHRLAYAEVALDAGSQSDTQFIIPRKGVQELARLLTDDGASLRLAVNANHLTVCGKDFTFTTKLIEGRFPDYQRVFPKYKELVAFVDRDILKQAISRAAILSSEKHRGIRVQFLPQCLKLSANNPEQEEAEEEIEADYSGDMVEIGLNASYFLDILGVLAPGTVKITFKDAKNSILIEGITFDLKTQYILMPMQI